MKIEINRRNVTSCRSIANSWNGHEIVLRGIRVGNESCFADSERRLMRIEKDESLSFSLLFFIHPTRCHIFVPLTIQKFSNSYVLNIIVFFFFLFQWLVLDKGEDYSMFERKLIVKFYLLKNILWFVAFLQTSHFPFLIRFTFNYLTLALRPTVSPYRNLVSIGNII